MKRSKILTVLISILMVVALAAFFAGSVIGNAANKNKTPLKALELLKLVPSISSSNTVTRMDALSYVLKITGKENANISTDSAFVDVNASDLLTVCNAKELGIIWGDGFDRFYPNRAITLEEMLIMCLRAMGYAPTAENVYELAEAKGIYKYSSGDNLYFNLTAGKVGEILWNLLSATDEISGVSYSSLLAEKGVLDGDYYADVCEQVNYTFGETSKVITEIVTENNWSPTWKP